MKPLSIHVLKTLLPALLLVLMLSGLSLKLLYTRSLIEDFDKALYNQATGIVAITEQDEDGVELEVNYESMPQYDVSEFPDYFAIFDQKSSMLFESRSLAHMSDFSMQVEPIGIEVGPEFSDVILPDGRGGRSISMAYYPKIDIDTDDEEVASPFFPLGVPATLNGEVVQPAVLTLWLSVDRAELDQKIQLLNITLAIASLLTALLLILTMFFSVRRAVRPIKSLTEKVTTWKTTDANQFLPEKTGIQETDVLTQEFNGLLRRVDSSIQREKRFSADLAHEIRTPIAEMKLLLDLHERWPEDTENSRNMTQELGLSVERIERLVENLLAIGKSESGIIDTSGETDFHTLLPNRLDIVREKIDRKSLSVSTDVSPGTLSSRGQYIWPLILDNLIENAVEYSPIGSKIGISAVVLPDQSIRLEIANTACDLDSADTALMFNRLWRKDESRNSTVHSGLGLSLVRNYCDLLECQIEADMASDDELVVSISGPA